MGHLSVNRSTQLILAKEKNNCMTKQLKNYPLQEEKEEKQTLILFLFF